MKYRTVNITVLISIIPAWGEGDKMREKAGHADVTTEEMLRFGHDLDM